MPPFILLGWMVGLVLGGIGFAVMLVLLGTAVPAFLTVIVAFLGPLIGLLPPWFTPWLVIALAMLFQILCFLLAYTLATRSIAPLLPAATGLTTITFPLAGKLGTPGGAITIPATAGEFFGRGMMIGLSAATNALMLSLIPGGGLVLASWAFTVISLSGILFVARSRVYQGFLGWSGWLFPLSYIATSVGMLLFGVNLLFALLLFGPRAFTVDWSTGVIESNFAIPGVTAFDGGFSLGNFTFLSGTARTTPASTFARFVTASLSSHETGHSLNTAAFGGIVLWINAVDENILPKRMNLAYGELTAEGHSNNLPGTPTPDFSVRLWF